MISSTDDSFNSDCMPICFTNIGLRHFENRIKNNNGLQ